MPTKNQVPIKSVREKSALYPAVTILTCLDFIRLIDSFGGKSVAYASIANGMGLTSITTKSFLTRISAAKQYGFITTSKNTVQLTEAARHFLYPSTGENERQKLLVDSFSKPPLYGKLLERFKDKVLPQKEQLSNILLNEYHIIKQVKDNAATCFIDSASYVGILQNGVLCLDTLDNPKQPIEINDQENSSPEATLPISQNSSININNPETGYNFEIPTLGKASARFYIPDGVTEKDLDYIKLYIEKMLPVFLENLKTQVKQE